MKLTGKDQIIQHFGIIKNKVAGVIKNFATSKYVKECMPNRTAGGLCFTVNNRFGKKHLMLNPGDYIVSCEDIIVSTVLGSCVSVCFYSDSSPFFGMNHFMLPEQQNNGSNTRNIMMTDAAFYGINAMEILINALLKTGVRREMLKAKVFGGGNVLSLKTSEKTVGEQNVEFVLNFLKMEKIPVVACSVGGDYARKIIYFQRTHEVLLQRLDHSRDRMIIEAEESLRTSSSKKLDIDFFS